MAYTNDQIGIGQQILGVVQSLGLSPADTGQAELAAIEGGLAESGLKNDTYGDYPGSMGGQMSSSRGVYQQIGAWGPLSARMDVPTSARMFLTGGQGGQQGLLSVPGWNTEPSWQAVQAVQGSEFADGSNYQAQYQAATDFIAQYGGGAVAPGSPGSSTQVPVTGASYTAKPAGLFSGIQQSVLGFSLKIVFAVTGLGLIGLGLWRLSSPAREKATSAAQTVPVAV